MTDEDVREPFYMASLDYRERLRRMVSTYSDEELTEIHDLFHVSHLGEIPIAFMDVGPKVRVLIRAELKRRAASEKA